MSKLLTNLQSELFETSCKLRGLAELLRSIDRDSNPLDDGEVWNGISMILRELGEGLRERFVEIDEHQIRRAQRKTFVNRIPVHDRGHSARKSRRR